MYEEVEESVATPGSKIFVLYSLADIIVETDVSSQQGVFLSRRLGTVLRMSLYVKSCAAKRLGRDE